MCSVVASGMMHTPMATKCPTFVTPCLCNAGRALFLWLTIPNGLSDDY